MQEAVRLLPAESVNALKEIASWQIEALDDDNIRYFYEIEEIKLLLSGTKNFVIGRKGTGKTAIAKHITTLDDHENFSMKMSFKNFPWNKLYALDDSGFTPPNQYISAWKVAIYSAVLRLYMKTDVCPKEVADLCAVVFPNEVERELRSGFSKLFERGFNTTIAGFGGGINARGQPSSQASISDLVDALETFVLERAVPGRFYIIFDELDEDYKDILTKPDHRSQFFQLLTSLFKAAQHVRYIFDNSCAEVVPLILLRSDIYDLLRDPDKNKWRDRTIDLNWTPAMLGRLLSYRLSRAIDADGPTLSFRDAWNKIFSVEITKYGHRSRSKKDTFHYILGSTYLRPRDLISYVRECAAAAIENEVPRISNEEIRQADERHSLYSRRELVDEMQSVVEDINQILDIFTENNKPVYSYNQLHTRLERYIQDYPRKDGLTPSKIIELLFYFGVVGNLERSGRSIFSYQGTHVLLRKNESLCLHRSLLKSLRVI